MTEIQRLKETRQLEPPNQQGPKGSLTISDIRLPLKKDFVTKIGTASGMICIEYLHSISLKSLIFTTFCVVWFIWNVTAAYIPQHALVNFSFGWSLIISKSFYRPEGVITRVHNAQWQISNREVRLSHFTLLFVCDFVMVWLWQP